MAEAVLAKKLGVEGTLLVDTRNGTLTAQEDYFERGGRMYYHPSGVGKMLAALGVPVEAASVAPEEPACEARSFVVTRRAGLNVRLLVARPSEGGEEIRIRVRNNRMFGAGESVRATPPPEGSAHWIIASRATRRRTANARVL